MKSDVMQEWLDSSLFSGSNAGYVEELYEAYLQDPQSVDAQWRATFDNLPKLANSASEQAHGPICENFVAPPNSHVQGCQWISRRSQTS